MRRAKKVPKTSAKADERRESLFEKYKDPSEDSVGPEGVERLCRDLQVDPADRKVLLMAWKMGAQQMGFFSRSEFEQGLRVLNANDVHTLKASLEQVAIKVDNDPDVFQSFYQFAFKFCLTEPRQKIIDIETCIQMLSIVMTNQAHLQPFIDFLQHQTEYKFINNDQWMGFYRFSLEVAPDCSDYDEAQAWPLLLDNYVEYRQKHPQHHA
ncbi:TPA: hypothetical protein ACH3X2_007066 [Trebouxia sp. C0005]